MINVWLFPCLLISFLLYSSIAVSVPKISSPSSQHLSHMGECEALLQFSHSFIIMRNASGYGCGNTYTSSVCCSVTSYPKTASWKNGTGCCSWDGVTCHRATNYVTGLDLSRSWLQGTFHSNSMLFSLPNLRWLNLAGCNFYGSQISPKFGDELSGTVDFEMFSTLKDLQYLYLPQNLNVLLQSDGNLSFPKLKVLNLFGCNLTGFPYFLSSSENLEVLLLNGNMISGRIPEWFWRVGRDTLTLLDLSSNNFAGEIPSSICEMSSLQELEVSNNRLNDTFPRCLRNLSSLSSLHLSKVLFRGPLPKSLGNCTSLVRLNVSYNEIYDTFPCWLNGSGRLRILDLQQNKFHGVVEDPLPPQLSYLRLSNNHFSGELPIIFSMNSTIYFVDLAINNFDGPLPIPPPTIWFYSISNNKFSGHTPYQICRATGLNVIDLSNNMLTGTLPYCFKNFIAHLSVLDLRANKFVGGLREIFVQETSLRTIRLSQNQLEGTLPRSLEYCKNLEVLDLSENELEGSFPYWLDTLPKLQVLVLRSNKFCGPIDSSKRNNHPFPKLRIFDLSNNKFYGPLPAKYIAKLKAMKNEVRGGLQYMGDEYYQDSIVVEMKGLKMELVKILTLFTTINFSINFFEGEIPDLIGDLKALKGLNFSHNSLSGNIPFSMGNLTNLEWLDLSSNKLAGKIPRGLADLASLSYLNLLNKQLVGQIPQSTQFDTVNRSFDWNSGLCGHPLPKARGNDAIQTHPSTSHEEEEKWD
ncbi:hypothetical protein CRG98_002089 [Punica granatum]|uniref:Uncharacterized protein n=2 Tax=Punica granatum TaxID=22663 RepID=A0A2I0L9X1_PUNGR|nr:hypothetical protein CRG98_002089 [Punica granatum]